VSSSSKQALIGLGALTAFLLLVSAVATFGNNTQGLRADVLSARRTEPGSEAAITISARDTEGLVQRVEVDFADGTAPAVRELEPDCTLLVADGMTQTFDFLYRFAQEGTYTVKAVVRTGGCGAKPEVVEAIRTIEVKPLRR